ncbi:MAG: hypothetical protein IJD95_06295 [Clostridia bacterium]|nr:hypothetical protein [Clostridia bacterium]
MKKLTVITLVMVLLLALCFSGNAAALPEGWIHTQEGGASANNFYLNDDGSITMGWGDPNVYWANLGVSYDVSEFNNNYTATVDVYVPSKVINGETVITGAPVIGVKANFDGGVEKNWIPSFAFKLVNYEGAPNIDPSAFENWGGTWNVVEIWDCALTGTSVTPSCTFFSDLNIVAGGWNKVTIVVKGDYVGCVINGQVVLDAVEILNANGNYFVLGSNGDCGDKANMPSFKNLIIKSNDDSVATLKAFTVDENAEIPEIPNLYFPSNTTKPESSEPAPSTPDSSITILPPAEEKGGCGNKA